MKINKSILGIAVMVIMLFSACSQARYGNLTRRTKATHLVKDDVVKPAKQKTENSNEIKEEVVLDYVALEDVVVEETPTVINSEVKTESIDEVAKELSVRSKAYETNEDKQLELPVTKRQVKKMIKSPKDVMNSIDKSTDTDDDSLVRSLLIIILIIILISLVLSLLPSPLKSIITTILLILLILYLISIL